MTNHTIRIHTRQLASLSWGHQEVPAKFNFATDVIDHWAGMEKVMGWKRGTQLENLAEFTSSSIHSISIC